MFVKSGNGFNLPSMKVYNIRDKVKNLEKTVIFVLFRMNGFHSSMLLALSIAATHNP